MAINNPLSPRALADSRMNLPMPPPLLHTRSGNADLYERPSTPTQNGFVSPMQTPQGSPSKKQLPPGASDLPNVFDNAMKLSAPQSPTKQPRSPLREEADPFADDQRTSRPELQTRQSNKENSPTRYKDTNQAALSRREQYQATEKRAVQTNRGLTQEELQKLALPKVKRLANVTQLCMFLAHS